MRDLVLAGLFIGQRNERGEFRIFLDFVIPDYRDFKIGNYLYYQSGFFQQHGIHKLMSTPHNSAHANYLKHMGFQQETDREGKVVCTLVFFA